MSHGHDTTPSATACTRCSGRGYVPYVIRDEDGFTTDVGRDCPTCGGSGTTPSWQEEGFSGPHREEQRYIDYMERDW
jgi:DnaJ-class molecular chaperone